MGSTRVIGVIVVRGGGGTRSSLQASAGSEATAMMAASSKDMADGRISIVGTMLCIFIQLF